jgi:hypothetical protein
MAPRFAEHIPLDGYDAGPVPDWQMAPVGFTKVVGLIGGAGLDVSVTPSGFATVTLHHSQTQQEWATAIRTSGLRKQRELRGLNLRDTDEAPAALAGARPAGHRAPFGSRTGSGCVRPPFG